MAGGYVNPFTDFGFKKLFGEEASKPILIDFLNALIEKEGHIKDIQFKNNEQLGQTRDTKSIIYDIYCENDAGEKFIVEMQKNKQDWFRERSVYYATFPIQEDVERGEPKFDKMKAVYCIGLLDFIFMDFETEAEKKEWKHIAKLTNQHKTVIYDKLTMLYLVMPNFNKKEDELETRLDKWLYFIKHLGGWDNIPEIFKKELVFVQAFNIAEIAKMTKEEHNAYFRNIKAITDYDAVLNTAVREAVEENTIKVEKETTERVEKETTERVAKETQFEMAKKCIKKGMLFADIADLTGLSEHEIKNINV